jgi:PAP_fibrillin
MLYLDDDLRVSKGNRGGVFVHVRPSSLLSKKADA